MFFEKNKFFQRVGWCSGRNHFYRNSEGVNRNLCKNLRNLLQDPAELVSGFRTLRQEKTRLFETVLLFLEVCVQIAGTDARFQAETSASGLKQLNDRILQPERPSTRGLRSG